MYFQNFKAALEQLRREGGYIKHHFGMKNHKTRWEVSSNIGYKNELDNFIATCLALAEGGMTDGQIKREFNNLYFDISGWSSQTIREKYIDIVIDD